MKEFLKKITSRKFLMALAGAVCGIITLFVGESSTITTVAGSAVTVISALGYCITEGVVDAKSVQSIADAVIDLTDDE